MKCLLFIRAALVMPSFHSNRTGTKTAREMVLLEQSSSTSRGQIKADLAFITVHSPARNQHVNRVDAFTVWISEMLL